MCIIRTSPGCQEVQYVFKNYSTNLKRNNLKFCCPNMVICTHSYPLEHAKSFGPRVASILRLVVDHTIGPCCTYRKLSHFFYAWSKFLQGNSYLPQVWANILTPLHYRIVTRNIIDLFPHREKYWSS